MTSVFTEQLPDWLKEYDPLMIQAAVALFMLVILVLIIVGIKKARKKSNMPGLLLSSFQIAPLGRDAFLKLSNPGESLTLLSMKILERPDIFVKNQVAGHILAMAATYSILLETSSQHKIGINFKVEVSFVDKQRKTYKQVFSLDPIESISIRKIRK